MPKVPKSILYRKSGDPLPVAILAFLGEGKSGIKPISGSKAPALGSILITYQNRVNIKLVIGMHSKADSFGTMDNHSIKKPSDVE